MCALRIGLHNPSSPLEFDQRYRIEKVDATSISANTSAITPPPSNKNALIAQLQTECDAMARYALQHGIAVSPELIAQLSTLVDIAPSSMSEGEPSTSYTLTAIHHRLAL